MQSDFVAAARALAVKPYAPTAGGSFQSAASTLSTRYSARQTSQPIRKFSDDEKFIHGLTSFRRARY